MTSWREYWDGPHPIYVSERHRRLHFDLIARDIVKLFPSPQAVVLDYGCGEAWTASDLARACGKTPFQISAVTGRGMTEVLRALRDVIVEANAGEADKPAKAPKVRHRDMQASDDEAADERLGEDGDHQG